MTDLDYIAVFDSYSFDDKNDSNKAQLLAIAKTNYRLMSTVLSESDRDLLIEYSTCNLTMSELAEKYQVSQPTISRRIRNAKATLRDYLKWCECAIRYYIDEIE